MIMMDNGTQNHTSAKAAPVIIDAVGTTPMLRDLGTGSAAGWTGVGKAVSLIATMPSTYEVVQPGDTAFS
ncbi:hypothetical protein MFTT_43210 [Mycolicibacterium fortuitum subsp. fortuitum]|nr:hypothetical protein MFTT_43210 [Mycolicibacterium fortuitum subsp. fortuitum]